MFDFVWPAVCSELQKNVQEGTTFCRPKVIPYSRNKDKDFLMPMGNVFCAHSDLLPLLLPVSIAVVIHRYILSTRQIDQEGRGGKRFKKEFLFAFSPN